jgi:hypothetical protein
MRVAAPRSPWSVVIASFVIVATGAPLAHAGNYPLGTMTCDDIGRFASETMAAKKSGQSLDDALAALDTRSYGDAAVEKRNLTDVTRILHGNRGRNLGVESAGKIMKGECEFGRTPTPSSSSAASPSSQ